MYLFTLEKEIMGTKMPFDRINCYCIHIGCEHCRSHRHARDNTGSIVPAQYAYKDSLSEVCSDRLNVRKPDNSIRFPTLDIVGRASKHIVHFLSKNESVKVCF